MKNSGLAAVLSFFFTGLGQIYNGQIGKGVVLIIIQIINVGLMFILIGFLPIQLSGSGGWLMHTKQPKNSMPD